MYAAPPMCSVTQSKQIMNVQQKNTKWQINSIALFNINQSSVDNHSFAAFLHQLIIWHQYLRTSELSKVMTANQYRLGMQGKHRDHCKTEYSALGGMRGRIGDKRWRGCGGKGGKGNLQNYVSSMCVCVSIMCINCQWWLHKFHLFHVVTKPP